MHLKECQKEKDSGIRSILIYNRKELRNFLSIFDKPHENISWLKLSMELFKTLMNLYIAVVYSGTKNSSYTKGNKCNIIDTLRDQLSKFSLNDIVFIGGKLSSKTGTQKIENQKDLNFLPQHYELDNLIGQKQSEQFNE